jgi:hypothetical protein
MLRSFHRGYGYYNAAMGQKYQRACKQATLLEEKHLDYIQSLILNY